jgi:hypothetical protein
VDRPIANADLRRGAGWEFMSRSARTASSGSSTSRATSSASSLQSENRDVISTRAPAEGRRSAMRSGAGSARR